MADVKIQDLLSTTTVADNDLFIVEDNADTKKITRANLRLNLMTFPTTKIPSSNPNTLDDYEEGTWTPTLYGGTTQGNVVYNNRRGKFTKIGNLVVASFYISTTSKGGAVGAITIGQLPFVVAGDTINSSVTRTYRVNNEIRPLAIQPIGTTNHAIVVYNSNITYDTISFAGAEDIMEIGATIIYFTT